MTPDHAAEIALLEVSRWQREAIPMTITRKHGGLPYSPEFLQTMYEDLRELANDYERCGGTSNDARKLLVAADLVKKIKRINEDAEQ